jgi:hypothetical protein
VPDFCPGSRRARDLGADFPAGQIVSWQRFRRHASFLESLVGGSPGPGLAVAMASTPDMVFRNHRFLARDCDTRIQGSIFPGPARVGILARHLVCPSGLRITPIPFSSLAPILFTGRKKLAGPAIRPEAPALGAAGQLRRRY